MSRSSTMDALSYRSLALRSVYRPIDPRIVEISFALRPSIYCSVIPIRCGHHVCKRIWRREKEIKKRTLVLETINSNNVRMLNFPKGNPVGRSHIQSMRLGQRIHNNQNHFTVAQQNEKWFSASPCFISHHPFNYDTKIDLFVFSRARALCRSGRALCRRTRFVCGLHETSTTNTLTKLLVDSRDLDLHALASLVSVCRATCIAVCNCTAEWSGRNAFWMDVASFHIPYYTHSLCLPAWRTGTITNVGRRILTIPMQNTNFSKTKHSEKRQIRNE